MTRLGGLLTRPLPLVAAALFAIGGLAGANPMLRFVDCTDSFWAIACDMEYEAPDSPSGREPEATEPTGGIDSLISDDWVVIDSDPTCADLPDGRIICHT